MPRPTLAANQPAGLVTPATHDPSTGLPNRVLLVDHLEMALANAQRYKDLVALVVIDLNRTTEIRATLGLEAGEELTRMVADHLAIFVRKTDTLAHIGSDLFAIIMPRARDLPQILGLTTRLLRLFDGAWELAGHSLHLAPGVGVACYPENGTAADELLAEAVTAASHAAELGELHPRLADPVWNQEARERLTLESDLRRALERDQFLLHYQPQVNAETGCITGLEALIRWQHPQRGLLLPNDFIPIAEQTRLIVPIGSWVVEEACRQLAAWSAAGYRGVRVAVNLAAGQLADESLVTLVRDALDRHRLDPAQLEVEITESTAIVDEATTARVLEQLKALGLRITLDDFGTGYSSALLFAQYPFDTLKIDRGFVMRALDGTRELAVTAAIITLAHAAGMTVVAEGVETRAQLDLLRELGADEIQGFYFSRPLPIADCEPLLAGRCSFESGVTS